MKLRHFSGMNCNLGDTVQPLDFVSGGVEQAMPLADATIATRYQFDSMLYHHVSSPYTQARQQDFRLNFRLNRHGLSLSTRIVRDRPGEDMIEGLPETGAIDCRAL
ncbi:MAG: hypothetical protein R3C44_11985 [Chloroflexota bacterium]